MSNVFASKEDAEFMAEVMCRRHGRLFTAKPINPEAGPEYTRWGVINATQQAFMWLDAKARFPLPMPSRGMASVRYAFGVASP